MDTKEFETNKNEIIESLQAENAALKEQIAKLEQQVEQLSEMIRLAQQKRFGASSEKSSEDTLEYLFNEAEVYADQKAAKAAEPEDTVAVSAHKRRKKHEYTLDELPENVPVEVVEHRLPEEKLVCPACGDTMTEIGKEVRRRIKIIPAQVVVVEDRYYTYACQRCNRENIEAPVVKAEREPNFMPGSFATPESVAHIMVQKFMMGSPLYRQEQELRRQGIPLSRQTMSNWLLWSAEHLLEPVYDQLHKELLKREVLHADETTLQVLHEPGKAAQSKSFMWLYRTGGNADRPIVLYEYQPGRGASHPQAFLAGFQGVSAYGRLCRLPRTPGGYYRGSVLSDK